MGGYGICERLVRSSHAATLARQHRAGFYELPELVVSGFARELREAADLIQQQLATIERLSAALEPFADFANLSGAAYLPDDHVITLGTGMAARQLTMGDCRKARTALGKDASNE